MAEIASTDYESFETYVLLSDGAFDQARGAGIHNIAIDQTVLKEAVSSLDMRSSHLPTLAVVGLLSDGSCKTEKFRERYESADPPTYVRGLSLWEDAPPIISRIGQHARHLRCQTLSFITVNSLLDPTDHYTALLEGLAGVQHAETLHREEESIFRREQVMPREVRIDPIYAPRDAFMQHANEVIQASQAEDDVHPSPFVVTYR